MRYRSLRQQAQDALWYLNKPGQKPKDEAKAIEILKGIAFGSDSATAEKIVKNIKKATPPHEDLEKYKEYVKGKEIAIITGHEPGGGAAGERQYNKIVAEWMVSRLELMGAKVFYYEHKTKSYGRRQDEMRAAIKSAQPNNFVCVELHYDAVSWSSPNGHHFQYLGSKELATCFAQTWQKRFPQSNPRGDNKKGIKYNPRGNGAGFLRKAPGWAVLTEPFFISNPQEKEFYKDKHKEVGGCFVLSIAKFCKLKTK